MKRSKQTRRRSLMIETSDHRASRTRRIRRRLPAIPWAKYLSTGKNSTWLILICIAMGVFIALAFLSPLFRVRNFRVTQKSPFIEVSLIEETLKEEIRGKNMLFLHKGDIRAILRKKMPELRDIEITEDWPRSLELVVDSARPKYNIFNTETANISVITEDGIVLAQQSIEGLPAIKIFQHPDIVLKRQQILSPSQLIKIHEAEGIMDSELMLPITAVEVYLAANELHFVSRGGMKIWLDLSRSIQTQLDKLISAEGKLKLYKEQFDHIDLRIPQQIFWQEL